MTGKKLPDKSAMEKFSQEIPPFGRVFLARSLHYL
jgi:hypothetical protein